MARLTEPRFATAGKFVPMKFREDSLPITESERLFKKCGSQFPPMTLEPLPYERDRVAERMSPEDRLRRKQWMEDQKIPKGEPRMEVMEKIKPTNAFRRFYQTPGKQLEGLFTSVTVSSKKVSSARIYSVFISHIELNAQLHIPCNFLYE